jgi:hypothetical protein
MRTSNHSSKKELALAARMTLAFLSESFENLKSSHLEDTEAHFSLLFQAVDSLVCSQAHCVLSGTGTASLHAASLPDCGSRS